MKNEEIIHHRGKVLHSFVTVELMINTIISMHYLKRVDSDFVIDVLNNEMSSFGFKKSILKQILNGADHESSFKKLEKLNRIRNLFAHATPILMNVDVTKNINDERAEVWFRNPKIPGTEVDPQIKFKEYNELFPQVCSWLNSIGRKNGINYPESN